MATTEFEARFLEIDTPTLVQRALALGGTDRGEDLLRETIYYDRSLTWGDQGTYARLRSTRGNHIFTYKRITADAIGGAEEVEFTVDKPHELESFLAAVDVIPFRVQEKRRHTIELGSVTLDIDTWPKIPTYLELEGPDEDAIRQRAMALGLSWDDAVFIGARKIIEQYGIDVGHMRYFTFEKCE